MVNALERRFNNDSIRLLKTFSVLHPTKLSVDNHTVKLETLAQFYEGDVNQEALKAEFEVLRNHQEIKECESVGEILQLLYQKKVV